MSLPAHPDETFLAALEKTRAWARDAAQSRLNQGDRPWYGEASRLDADPLDVPGQGGSFDRSGLNAALADAVRAGAGRLGTTMALQAQGDYLAAMERAARLALASRVRRSCWAAARLVGHGTEGRGAFARVAGYAQDLLAAGVAVQAPEGNPNNLPTDQDVQALVEAARASVADDRAGFLQQLPQ